MIISWIISRNILFCIVRNLRYDPRSLCDIYPSCVEFKFKFIDGNIFSSHSDYNTSIVVEQLAFYIILVNGSGRDDTSNLSRIPWPRHGSNPERPVCGRCKSGVEIARGKTRGKRDLVHFRRGRTRDRARRFHSWGKFIDSRPRLFRRMHRPVGYRGF